MALLLDACKHEPMDGPAVDDGNGGTDPGEQPCDPNTIWFQQQVLPILTSSCTNPGQGLNCHHTANDNNDEIQITSYATLMASGIVQNGDLMEAITDNDPDDIMPRPPFSPLTADQIALIQIWINQGAQNNSCESAACDTLNVTYSGTIAPIMQARCTSCHSGSAPSGGLNLTQWGVVNQRAMDGTLEGAVRHLGDPFINMPPLGPQLSSCRIRQIQLWIAQGAPNN
ncbi:MAG: hypothetical protein IPJ85_03135 [Flavobacteriales bacterium]|nr:hypothetical protein [Flavobacteriales bacterium]